MKPKDLDSFKTMLTHWLDELLGKAGNTVVGLIGSEDHLSDPLDRAVLDSERSYTFRIRGRESVLIKKIHVMAFRWIGRGTPRKYCQACKGGSDL